MALVGWYRPYQDQDWTDHSEEGNDLTLSGSPTIVSDTGSGGSHAFDFGSSERATASSIGTDITDEFAVAAWIKITTLPFGIKTAAMFYGHNQSHELAIGVNGTEIIARWNDGNTSLETLNSGVFMSLNTWYHVAFTANGAADRKLYVNGVEEASSTTSKTWPATSDNISIGGNGLNSSHYFSFGRVDDARFYNTGISSSDVTTLYNSGSRPIADADIELTAENLESSSEISKPDAQVWALEQEADFYPQSTGVDQFLSIQYDTDASFITDANSNTDVQQIRNIEDPLDTNFAAYQLGLRYDQIAKIYSFAEQIQDFILRIYIPDYNLGGPAATFVAELVDPSDTQSDWSSLTRSEINGMATGVTVDLLGSTTGVDVSVSPDTYNEYDIRPLIVAYFERRDAGATGDFAFIIRPKFPLSSWTQSFYLHAVSTSDTDKDPRLFVNAYELLTPSLSSPSENSKPQPSYHLREPLKNVQSNSEGDRPEATYSFVLDQPTNLESASHVDGINRIGNNLLSVPNGQSASEVSSPRAMVDLVTESIESASELNKPEVPAVRKVLLTESISSQSELSTPDANTAIDLSVNNGESSSDNSYGLTVGINLCDAEDLDSESQMDKPSLSVNTILDIADSDSESSSEIPSVGIRFSLELVAEGLESASETSKPTASFALAPAIKSIESTSEIPKTFLGKNLLSTRSLESNTDGDSLTLDVSFGLSLRSLESSGYNIIVDVDERRNLLITSISSASEISKPTVDPPPLAIASLESRSEVSVPNSQLRALVGLGSGFIADGGFVLKSK